MSNHWGKLVENGDCLCQRLDTPLHISKVFNTDFETLLGLKLNLSKAEVHVIDLMNDFKIKSRYVLPDLSSVPTSVSIHPKKPHILAMGFDDSTILIYDVFTKEIIHTLQGHSNRVSNLVFSGPLDILLSAGADSKVCVWSTTEWEMTTSMVLPYAYSHSGLGRDVKLRLDKSRTDCLVVQEGQFALYKRLNYVGKWVVPTDRSSRICDATFTTEEKLLYVLFTDAAVWIFSQSSLNPLCCLNSKDPLAQYLGPSSYTLGIIASPLNSTELKIVLNDGTMYKIMSSGSDWPMPPMVPLHKLPDDILKSLLSRLSLQERVCTLATCSEWFSAIKVYKSDLYGDKPAAAPLLLFDPATRPGYAYYNPSDEVYHFKIRLPTSEGNQISWYGSNGGYLFFVEEGFRCSLLQPFTYHKIELPSMVTFLKRVLEVECADGTETYNGLSLEEYRLKFVRRFAICRPPMHENGYLIVGFFVGMTIITTADKNDWIKLGYDVSTLDAILWEGELLCLSEYLRIYSVDLSTFQIREVEAPTFPKGSFDTGYLFVNEGQLFLVHIKRKHWTILNVSFFRIKLGSISYSLEPVYGLLHGKSLFVGSGQSMILESTKGIEENHIYISNDSIFQNNKVFYILDAAKVNVLSTKDEAKVEQTSLELGDKNIFPKPIWIMPSLVGEPIPPHNKNPMFTFGLTASKAGAAGLSNMNLPAHSNKIIEIFTKWNSDKSVKFLINFWDFHNFSNKADKLTAEGFETELRMFDSFDGKVYHVIGHVCNISRGTLIPLLKIPSEGSCAYYEFSPYAGFRFIILDAFESGWPKDDKIVVEANQSRSEKNPTTDKRIPDGLAVAERRLLTSNEKGVGKEQLRWLAETLRDCERKKENAVICSDIALVPEIAEPLFWNYDEVMVVIHKFKCVKACFAGRGKKGRHCIDSHGIHHLCLGAMKSTSVLKVLGQVDAHMTVLSLTGPGQMTEMSF